MPEKENREELAGGYCRPVEVLPTPACKLADKETELPKEPSEDNVIVQAQVKAQTQQSRTGTGCYGVTAFRAVSQGVKREPPTPKHSPIDSIEQYLRSYLSFPDDRYYFPLSLFAVLQHCWDECFDEVPYLSVSAAVKGAGKTRVLELLKFLAGEDKAVLVDGSITVAAVYTEIEEKKVILFDESERLQNPHSPFRSILNGGYRRGQYLIRKIGGQNRRFSLFCPKVFAQIGDLYDSLRDRCIIVEMQRRMSGNRNEYVQQTAKEEGAKIASEIVAAIRERMEEIRNSYLNYHNLYASLDFLRDRDKEIWKPLFTLCQLFAPERIPSLERSAIDIATLKTLPVRRFEQLREEEERAQKLEYAEHLLRDTLTVIGARDRITSGELMTGLRGIATSPWRSYEGTGITEISLAAMLKLFNVAPKTIRIKPKNQPNSTAKGYLRAHLAEAAMAIRCETDEVTASTCAGDKICRIERGSLLDSANGSCWLPPSDVEGRSNAVP
jgi:hypothetical protein